MRATITWDVPPDVWQAFLNRCPQATFYHTPGWYAVHAQQGLYRPNTALIRYDDGHDALLPLAVRRRFRGLLEEAQAGIEGGYGGLLAPNALSPAQQEAAYHLVRRRYANLRVTGNPHDPSIWLPDDGPPAEDVTHLVPVLDRLAQLQRMTDTRAARVKKAAKAGFDMAVIERPTPADAARFFALYAQHATSWKSRNWVRDEAYFQALFHHAGPDLVLFLVHHQGELAGFRLLARQGAIALGLHLAATEAHEKLNAGPFMIGETLAWCHDNGVRVFDFLPSGPLEGVKAYKASYGAEPCPLRTTQYQGWLGRGLQTAWRLSRGPAQPEYVPRSAS